jgi:hypothetical protein
LYQQTNVMKQKQSITTKILHSMKGNEKNNNFQTKNIIRKQQRSCNPTSSKFNSAK